MSDAHLHCAARYLAAAFVVVAVFAGRAEAQLGALVSPGRLASAHASLEGVSNCSKCHEQGRRVTPQKCLACHAPIADRIARKTGVHRTAGGDCVTCHADHAGVDGQLRPFDQQAFNHTTETTFPLAGRHQSLSGKCESCHKTRSFLSVSTTCVSCHADVHKGSLGANCQTCHSTDTAFNASGGAFDHTKAAFQLAGAHKTVACAKCHSNGTFKGVAFSTCTSCHAERHRPSLGATCTSCHTSDSWKTTKIDHTRTAFALEGRHAQVACSACHKQAPVKVQLKTEPCAACHTDVHNGAFAEDCKSCHSVNGFREAPFDHTRTKFALTGKHEGLTCASCHTPAGSRQLVTFPAAATPAPPGAAVTDFLGLKGECASCHADVHRGEVGASCDTCHTSSTFKVAAYTHRRPRDFFAGQHTAVACDKCHVSTPAASGMLANASTLRVQFTTTATACATCHKDVHLGQVGGECQTCHSLERERFALPGFEHPATSFALTGRHQSVECAQCHKRENGVFPAGPGTAVRYKGGGTECRACHADVHLGQVSDRCDTCHTTMSFKVTAYTHTTRAVSGFFTGKHAAASCADCHKTATGKFPAAIGTAVRLRMDASCVTCHADIHRGALGSRCDTCHRP